MFWEGAWFGWKAALRRMPTWGGKDKLGWGADPDCPRADMMAEGGGRGARRGRGAIWAATARPGSREPGKPYERGKGTKETIGGGITLMCRFKVW